MQPVTSRFWPRLGPVLCLCLALLGCSTSDKSEPTEAGTKDSRPESAAPYSGYPDSIAALGHSAITGEGTQPGAIEMKANSWATGTNPEVKSIYLRILDKNPSVEGHNVNLGAGGADVTSLAAQAQSLIAEDPQPQLVLISTLDGDIQCPAGQDDLDQYRDALAHLLHELSVKMPESRFFITTQVSTPREDARIYPRRARAAALGGTGPCAFLDPDGFVVPKELERLETAVARFKTQVTMACQQAERCSTDQSGAGWRMRAQYSDDLNHLNLIGQARWAEYIWGLLKQAQLVPEQ